MLQHNASARPAGATIRLAAWDRAPLNLSHDVELFFELIRPPREVGYVELFASPFTPACWGDLWQLDLVTHEACGTLASLTDLLASRGVVSVAVETTACDGGERHKISILCDCRRYASDGLDRDSAHRQSRERVDLFELRAAIAVEFIEHLVFPNRVEPALFLIRNDGHYRAHKRIERAPHPPHRAIVDRGCIELPPSLVRSNEESLGTPLSESRYLPLSDSSDRTLRIIFTPLQSRLLHLRGEVQGDVSVAISIGLSELRAEGFNVVRSRLRFGASDVRRSGLRERSRTFDLFVQAPAKLMTAGNAVISKVLARVANRVSLQSQSDVRVRLISDPGDHAIHSQVDSNQPVQADPSGSPSEPRRAAGAQG